MKDKTETVILKVGHCCQLAENSAAELKRGRKNAERQDKFASDFSSAK